MLLYKEIFIQFLIHLYIFSFILRIVIAFDFPWNLFHLILFGRETDHDVPGGYRE